MIYIIKKDGTKEGFDAQKIVRAVNKSAQRILYTFSDEEISFICQFATEHAKALAREKGYAETLFGRRRYLPDIQSANGTVRGFAERNAINAPIQGTEADIIKIAMIRIHRRFREEGIRSKMILQVHDELNFSVYPDEKERVEKIVIEEMQGACQLTVPLLADAGWGKNWLEAH